MRRSPIRTRRANRSPTPRPGARPNHTAMIPTHSREAVQPLAHELRRRGHPTISGAAVLLRRRSSSRHWCRACSLADIPQGLGPRLPGIVAANDRLASGVGPFTKRVRPAPGLDVERRQRPGEHERARLICRAAVVTRRSSSRPSRRPSCVSTAPARSANYSTTAKQPGRAARTCSKSFGLLDFADADDPLLPRDTTASSPGPCAAVARERKHVTHPRSAG